MHEDFTSITIFNSACTWICCVLCFFHSFLGFSRSSAQTISSNFIIVVTTFVVSAIVSHQHKLDMVHIQNSTLAGGVAIGSCCNLLVGPHGALLIGTISAIISVLGYRYLMVSYICKNVHTLNSEQWTDSFALSVCYCVYHFFFSPSLFFVAKTI